MADKEPAPIDDAEKRMSYSIQVKAGIPSDVVQTSWSDYALHHTRSSPSV